MPAPVAIFSDTKDHLGWIAWSWLAKKPEACQHAEMETYTWEVLPEEMRSFDVVDQRWSAEYAWTLNEMKRRNLA